MHSKLKIEMVISRAMEKYQHYLKLVLTIKLRKQLLPTQRNKLKQQS